MLNEQRKSGEGRKDDSGKLRWGLLPVLPVQAVIRVLMKGADKYADHNWMKVPNARARYYDAAMRHLTEWWEGKDIDEGEGGSGESPLANALCCLLFLLWFVLTGTGDDPRPPRPDGKESKSRVWTAASFRCECGEWNWNRTVKKSLTGAYSTCEKCDRERRV